jgi:hypothetical protein
MGVIALRRGREEAGPEGAGPGARKLDLQRDGAYLQGAGVRAVSFIGGRSGPISLSFGLAEAVQDEPEEFAQAEGLEAGGESLGDLGRQGPRSGRRW